MYGLPRCVCGGTVFNEDSGKCDDCTYETASEAAAEQIALLEERVRVYGQLTADLASLAACAGNRPIDGVGHRSGPTGRFLVLPAADLQPGDRRFDPVTAITACEPDDVNRTAADLAVSAALPFDTDRPLLVWRPDDPFTRCPGCARPLCTGCEPSCRAEADRQHHLEQARASNAQPFAGISLEVPCYNGKGVATASITLRLRRPLPVQRLETVEDCFTRLRSAFTAMSIPVNVTCFDVEPAGPWAGIGGAWDLTVAASMLLATGAIYPLALDSTLMWAQIEADGALVTPAGRDATIAAFAARAGYERLITAPQFSAIPGSDCELILLRTLGDFASWARRS